MSFTYNDMYIAETIMVIIGFIFGWQMKKVFSKRHSQTEVSQ